MSISEIVRIARKKKDVAESVLPLTEPPSLGSHELVDSANASAFSVEIIRQPELAFFHDQQTIVPDSQEVSMDQLDRIRNRASDGYRAPGTRLVSPV